MSWVKKHDSGSSVTNIWHQMFGSERIQVRQPADVHMDVNGCGKTEMRDPNSEEGDTEEY